MGEGVKAKLWIGMFFIMLCGSQLCWLLWGKSVEEAGYENRAAAVRPAFSLETLEEYPALYEAYYNDHLPWRDRLIHINSALAYFLFRSSSNQNVIRGQDGWLFYNSSTDDNPIEAYKGMGLFTQDELEQIADNLVVTANALAERGIEFVLFIAPNKERIYAEHMPSYYGMPAEVYRAGQLVGYLERETDIRVVYPYEALLAAKEQTALPLYYRLDTHWNYIGAYTGSRELAAELGVRMPALEELAVEETAPTICDLADMLHLRDELNQDPDYVLSGYDMYHLATDKHDLTGEYIYHCEGADQRNLFMLRDSFADAMDDFIASMFDASYMVHYSSYTNELVDREQPDIFVYETVERRLGELLTFRIE